jgi:hypothetical protein
MFDRLTALLDRSRTLRELCAMGERDLDDIGVSRGELEAVVTAPPQVTERMLAMAARHGVGQHELAGHNSDFAGMIESCRSCESLGACRGFLADPAADPARAVFCPNHATYDALCAASH